MTELSNEAIVVICTLLGTFSIGMVIVGVKWVIKAANSFTATPANNEE